MSSLTLSALIRVSASEQMRAKTQLLLCTAMQNVTGLSLLDMTVSERPLSPFAPMSHLYDCTVHTERLPRAWIEAGQRMLKGGTVCRVTWDGDIASVEEPEEAPINPTERLLERLLQVFASFPGTYNRAELEPILRGLLEEELAECRSLAN